jgi:hypothetical protein
VFEKVKAETMPTLKKIKTTIANQQLNLKQVVANLEYFFISTPQTKTAALFRCGRFESIIKQNFRIFILLLDLTVVQHQ